MRVPQLIPLACVAIALLAVAELVNASSETTQELMIPPELLTALQEEKLHELPKSLLADRDVLVDQLVTVIKEPPGESDEVRRFIRGRAVIVLGIYGGLKAIPTLTKLAEDKAEEFRRPAIVGLGRTKTKEGVSLAARFLRHDDELFREAAIDALAASDRKDALELLSKFDLADDKLFIQSKKQEAIEGLTNRVQSALLIEALNEPDFKSLPDKLLEDRGRLIPNLIALASGQIIPETDTPSNVRRRAIISLGMYGRNDAVDAIKALVENGKEEFRRDALLAIGRTQTEEGVVVAVKFLKHEDELLREAAIDTLGASNRQDALDALKVLDVSKEKPFIIRKHREMIDKLTAATVGKSLHP